MYIGAHFSINGGLIKALERAKLVEAECVQIFVSNPRSWAGVVLDNQKIKEFNEAYNKYNFKSLAVHMPYLPNIATPDTHIYRKSIAILKKDIDLAAMINADYYVIHPGNSLEASLEKSIKRAADAINILLSNTQRITILIENTAGQGTEIGFVFSQLGEILAQIKNKRRIGLCIDTAHLFAAGYDFRTPSSFKKVLKEANNFFDLSVIKMFHLNDTTAKLASNIDRHYYISEGEIGLDGFKTLLKVKDFAECIGICETPEEEDQNHQRAIAILKNI